MPRTYFNKVIKPWTEVKASVPYNLECSLPFSPQQASTMSVYKTMLIKIYIHVLSATFPNLIVAKSTYGVITVGLCANLSVSRIQYSNRISLFRQPFDSYLQTIRRDSPTMSAASLMRCGNFEPRSDTSVTAKSASDFDPDSFTASRSTHIPFLFINRI